MHEVTNNLESEDDFDMLVHVNVLFTALASSLHTSGALHLNTLSGTLDDLALKHSSRNGEVLRQMASALRMALVDIEAGFPGPGVGGIS